MTQTLWIDLHTWMVITMHLIWLGKFTTVCPLFRSTWSHYLVVSLDFDSCYCYGLVHFKIGKVLKWKYCPPFWDIPMKSRIGPISHRQTSSKSTNKWRREHEGRELKTRIWDNVIRGSVSCICDTYTVQSLPIQCSSSLASKFGIFDIVSCVHFPLLCSQTFSFEEYYWGKSTYRCLANWLVSLNTRRQSDTYVSDTKLIEKEVSAR